MNNLEVLNFLYESNMIESEPSGRALLGSYYAWDYMISKKKLAVEDILALHALLMWNIDKRIAGNFRECQVTIGGHLGINPASIIYALEELVKTVPKTWEEIKDWHVKYEDIHPFEDGNGRSGRIIMNWHRVINDLPVLVIHHGQEQMEYYDWFKGHEERNKKYKYE